MTRRRSRKSRGGGGKTWSRRDILTAGDDPADRASLTAPDSLVDGSPPFVSGGLAFEWVVSGSIVSSLRCWL